MGHSRQAGTRPRTSESEPGELVTELDSGGACPVVSFSGCLCEVAATYLQGTLSFVDVRCVANSMYPNDDKYLPPLYQPGPRLALST